MGKVNIVKDEVLEVKYIRDNSFVDGFRKDVFCSKVHKSLFKYGEIHFTNGLKLRIDNSEYSTNKIKIKNKYLASSKKYRVKYVLTWEGKTSYTNGSINDILDVNYIYPSSVILKDFEGVVPKRIIDYLDRFASDENCNGYSDFYGDDLIRHLDKQGSNLSELIWLYENMFKTEKNLIGIVASMIYKYILKSRTGYKGIGFEDIEANFKEKVLDIFGGDVDFEKSWNTITNSRFLYQAEEEGKYFPEHYTD